MTRWLVENCILKTTQSKSDGCGQTMSNIEPTSRRAQTLVRCETHFGRGAEKEDDDENDLFFAHKRGAAKLNLDTRKRSRSRRPAPWCILPSDPNLSRLRPSSLLSTSFWSAGDGR